MKKFLPYVLFLLLTLVFFWKPVFKGEVIFPASMQMEMLPYANSQVYKEYKKDYPQNTRQWNALTFDSALEFYPWRAFLGRSIKSGEIPKENPYSFSGTPFIANGQSAVFYPLNLLYAMFSIPVAFTIFVMLHVFLLQVFMFLFLSRLKLRSVACIFGAISFAFSGFVVTWLALPTFVSVICFLPLTFYFLHRTVYDNKWYYALCGGGALALAFLAGHLQIAIFVTMASFLYGAFLIISNYKKLDLKSIISSVLIFILVFGALASIQLAPSLKMSKLSHRATVPNETGYEWVINNSIDTWRYITLFMPKAFGDPTKDNYLLVGYGTNKGKHINSAADYIEYSMYTGIITLLFVIMGLFYIKKRDILFFACFGAFFLWLASGGAVYKLFYYYVMGFSSLGAPNRSICIVLFALSVLGAIGFNKFISIINSNDEIILKSGTKFKTKVFVPAMAFISLLLLLIFTYSNFMSSSTKIPIFNILNASVLNNFSGFFMWIFVILIAVVIVGLINKYNKENSSFILRNSSILLVLVLFVDLFMFGVNFNETTKSKYVYPKTELISKMLELKDSGAFAIINDRWSMFQNPKVLLPPNSAMYYGFKEVGGYDSLFLRKYKDTLEKDAGMSLSPVENGNMILIKRPFKGLNKYAKYAVSTQNIPEYKKLGIYDGINLYEIK